MDPGFLSDAQVPERGWAIVCCPSPARRARPARRPAPLGGLARAAGCALAAAVLLAGCLEVEQHPPYANGAYDGKPDDLPEKVFFRGDAQAWLRQISGQRLPQQNEYNRFGRDEVKPQ